MKSTEIVKQIAEKTGLTQGNVKSVLDALTDTSVEALKQNKTISIANLVTLKSVNVPEKSGVSFKKPWTKAAHTTVKASVSKKYRTL